MLCYAIRPEIATKFYHLQPHRDMHITVNKR